MLNNCYLKHGKEFGMEKTAETVINNINIEMRTGLNLKVSLTLMVALLAWVLGLGSPFASAYLKGITP
jgi:hypothetical protein